MNSVQLLDCFRMPTDANQFDSIDEASSLVATESHALIKAAQSGCDDALNELIKSLRSYLLLIANQDLDADIRAKVAPSDLVQSVLFRAQQNLADFRGTSRQTLLAWLRTILANEIGSARRKYLATRKRAVHREIATTSTVLREILVDQKGSPQSNAISQEESERLRAAVEQLPVDYRTVIYLRNWEQLSFAEIGLRMDRSEDAAKKLWARAFRSLEKELSDAS